jgi:lipopolysaccharide/colanic/teichoic acid biosynthesis glycosyltransferase
MHKRRDSLRTAILVAFDSLAVLVALITAYYVRIGSGVFEYYQSHDIAPYIRLTLLTFPLYLIMSALARLYREDGSMDRVSAFLQVVKSTTFTTMGLMVLSFWAREITPSRAWLLLSWILVVFLVSVNRFFILPIIGRSSGAWPFTEKILFVGFNEQTKAIVEQFRRKIGPNLHIVGILDDFLPIGTRVLGDVEILGSATDLNHLTRENLITEVIVVPSALAWESFQDILQGLVLHPENIDLKIAPGLYEALTTGVRVSNRASVPLLSLERARIVGVHAAVKAVFDYGLALVCAVLAIPILALIALRLWYTGKTIIDRHVVFGLNGRRFVTYKFHTRLLGTSRRSIAGPATGIGKQDVSFPFGLFLYRSGLDKLPQLFNVLRGEMSFVGPRTVTPGTEAVLGSVGSSLLTVKPGLTGPWAVSAVPTLQDEVQVTLTYIRNWSLWLDVQILIRTLTSLIRLRGVRFFGNQNVEDVASHAPRPNARAAEASHKRAV